jgi:hypothetical protein
MAKDTEKHIPRRFFGIMPAAASALYRDPG